MQKLILNLHIYGGLLCFSYLIIFGISSLNFNHPFAFTKVRATPTTWQQAIYLPDLPRVTSDMKGPERVAAKAQANNAVREALRLFCHQRPWDQSWWDAKDPDHYRASLVRPGVEYDVDVHLDRNTAFITETRMNAWLVVEGLHGFHGSMPGSTFVSTWGWSQSCARSSSSSPAPAACISGPDARTNAASGTRSSARRRRSRSA